MRCALWQESSKSTALAAWRRTAEPKRRLIKTGLFPNHPESKRNQVLALTEPERAQYRARAMERVRQRYSWDAVTDAYEELLGRLAGEGRAPGANSPGDSGGQVEGAG
jgi:hypothetical protein